MAVPATLFLAINIGGPGARGWGIPMATDIAFALGVVALLGARVPEGLKLFLLALAIVDDIGAVAVIAVFYTEEISATWLAAAAAVLGVLGLLRLASVAWLPAYLLLGAGLWFAMDRSGVHATVAGVLLAIALPRDKSESVERLLHPVTSYAIVPIFALANAGVALAAGERTGPGAARVAVGVSVGLVAGKLVGVLAGAFVAVRLRLGELPADVGWRHVTGGAALAGIGFTVSLFITDLAFVDAHLRAAAKFGIVTGSLAATVLGSALLFRRSV